MLRALLTALRALACSASAQQRWLDEDDRDFGVPHEKIGRITPFGAITELDLPGPGWGPGDITTDVARA